MSSMVIPVSCCDTCFGFLRVRRTTNPKVIREGPRRRKLYIDYNGSTCICPQNHPFLWTDPQTQLPASSLEPSDLPSQTAFISDQPCVATMYRIDRHIYTDRMSDRPTDGWREYSMKPLLLYRERRSLMIMPSRFKLNSTEAVFS